MTKKITAVEVKMDRTLTFRQHLKSVKYKIKTRNNIIAKLTGTRWGCHVNVFRTFALALVCSVAECWASVGDRSAHCNKIDVQLNNTMRVITRTVKSTQLDWLSVLSNIDPPDLCKQARTESMLLKFSNYPDLPVHIDIVNHPSKRLKSRNPI